MTNFLFVSYDSCRWDTFEQASKPILASFAVPLKAFAQATFTYAAHLAMLQGLLPHVRESIPFYNRFVRQLIRIRHRPTQQESFLSFAGDTPDIVIGFRRGGYYTLGLGAMEWFRHPHLTNQWEEFHHTGIHAERQVSIFLERTSDESRPFFSLINFGETHEPYLFCSEGVPPSLISRARRIVSAPSSGIDRMGWQSQVSCCEYLDRRLGDIVCHLANLSRPTIVIVCGDHGECFGEDGLIGHGFYHPKVMEVPLAIFEINADYLTSELEAAGLISPRTMRR